MTQDDILAIANDMAFMGSIWIEDDSDEFKDMIKFAQLVAAKKHDSTLEEVAQEIAKLPFGDTASSFAVFVRQMKVNRSDNESGRSPLSATSTSAE